MKTVLTWLFTVVACASVALVYAVLWCEARSRGWPSVWTGVRRPWCLCIWRDIGPFTLQWNGGLARTWKTLLGVERCSLPQSVSYWLRIGSAGIGVHFERNTGDDRRRAADSAQPNGA